MRCSLSLVADVVAVVDAGEEEEGFAIEVSGRARKGLVGDWGR